MSISKPSSQVANINQKPQTIFTTENIQDPVVRHNFDILNKQLQLLQVNSRPAKTNMQFGPILTTQNVIVGSGGPAALLSPLAVTIKTKGNPVSIKLMGAPQALPTSGLAPFFDLAANSNLAWAYIGWQRNGVQVYNQVIRAAATTGGSPDVDIISTWFPLPAFEFIDKVPSGSWRYQFTINPIIGSTVAVQQVQVVAKEET